MRVLVATSAFPLPVRDGLRLQMAGLLGELSRRDEVVLVSQVGPGDDVTRAPGICRRLVEVAPSPGGRLRRLRQELATARSRRPVLAEQATSSPLAEALRAAVAEHRPDVVHVAPAWLAELLEGLDCATVVAALDAAGPNWDADGELRDQPPAPVPVHP